MAALEGLRVSLVRRRIDEEGERVREGFGDARNPVTVPEKAASASLNEVLLYVLQPRARAPGVAHG